MVTCTVPCRRHLVHGLHFLIGDNIICNPNNRSPSCNNGAKIYFVNISRSLIQIQLNNNSNVSCYALYGNEVCYSNVSEIDFIDEKTSSLPSTIVTTESQTPPMIIRSKLWIEFQINCQSFCMHAATDHSGSISEHFNHFFIPLMILTVIIS